MNYTWGGRSHRDRGFFVNKDAYGRARGAPTHNEALPGPGFETDVARQSDLAGGVAFFVFTTRSRVQKAALKVYSWGGKEDQALFDTKS